MKESIKKRIEAVRHGEVPEGYRIENGYLIPNDWKTVPLNRRFTRSTRKNKSGCENVLTISAQMGLVNQREFYDKDIASEDKSGYFLMKNGEFAYNKSYSTGYPYGAIKQLAKYDEGIVSPLYICFAPKAGTNTAFYTQYFEGGRYNREIYRIAQEGARNHGLLNIAVDDFFTGTLTEPGADEQQRIAEILATCDRVIELKQQLLEEKQRQKRAYLQKMLPQSGCDVPEWRLTGFYLPWQKKKLGELVTFYNGLTYSPDDIRTEGTLVLRSSNVKDGEIVDADNVYVDPAAVNSENVQIGDIIVVVRNGSRALIGKHAEIKADMPNTVIGAFMTGIRSEYPPFVNVLLSTPQFDAEIQKNLGAAINQITGYMFAKMEFMVPEPAERVAIGEFFRAIDNLIALYQRELEQEKQKKKALMQLLLTGLVRVNA